MILQASPYIRRAIWERDGGVCGICGESVGFGRTMHVDRIDPARRGYDDPSNLQTTHRRCNLVKGGRERPLLRHRMGTPEMPGYVGTSVNLRLEPEMHAELVRIAKDEERSLAGQIKLYLKRALEARQAEQGQPVREADRGE